MTPPTSSSRMTAPSRTTASTPCAPTSAASCPWNKAENKFKCPCHGSQYNADGKVIRGPAPLSLALAHVVVTDSDVVTFTPWTEADFRTGQNPPWWK